MDYQEQQKLKVSLRENFPNVTSERLEEMFQRLVSEGGKEVYIKEVDGQVWYVGVICGTLDCSLQYYSTEFAPKHFWNCA